MREPYEGIGQQVVGFRFFEVQGGEAPDNRSYVASNAMTEEAGFRPDVRLAAGIAKPEKGRQVIARAGFSNA